MKTDTLTVLDLFQMERRYVVPLFQRRYVWTEQKQWAPLWDDVREKADDVLAAQEDRSRTIRKHFMGAAVINQIRTFGRQTQAMEVIDGQQRLTTLQLLLCALKDYAANKGFCNSARTLERLTTNSLNRQDDADQYKVWPTSSDRADYVAVFAVGTDAVITTDWKETTAFALRTMYPLNKPKFARKPEPRANLVGAYLFFYDSIGKYIDEASATSPQATQELCFDALVDAVTNYLEVVVIELEGNDDPQIIFETLNTRGESLLTSDLIRNFVFLEASRQKNKGMLEQTVEQLYHTYWREYDDNAGQDEFWKQSQAQGRLLLPRFDVFISHYLTEKKEDTIRTRHLYTEFREWWLNNHEDNVEPGLQDLQATAQVYRRFFNRGSNSRLSVFCNRLETLEVGTVYPLLLFLMSPQSPVTTRLERDGILTDLESYLIRRLVCDLTPKDYNNVFVSLLKAAKKETVLDRAAFLRILGTSQVSTRKWPTDAEFRKAWLETKVYEKPGARKVSLILEAIDLQMLTSKQEKVHIENPVTVEHIMPQNWLEQSWPFPTTVSSNEEREERKAYRDTVLQTMGNLTLLTQPLNSSIGNRSFAHKRQEIAANSLLPINLYFNNLDDNDTWNEETIAARGKALFQIAKEIWPGPQQ